MHSCKPLQSCPTLCDLMEYSPSGSSIHGNLQARILEWVAMPSSRGSSWSRCWTSRFLCLLYWQVGSLPLVPSVKPSFHIFSCKASFFVFLFFLISARETNHQIFKVGEFLQDEWIYTVVKVFTIWRGQALFHFVFLQFLVRTPLWELNGGLLQKPSASWPPFRTT